MTSRPPEALILASLPTPLGPGLILFDETETLRAFDWESHEERMRRLMGRHYGPRQPARGAAPASLAEPFERYFAGDLAALSAVPWTTGGTAFQRAVWRALGDIPAGRTETYGGLAARIGAPRAVRAVGLANGANPVGIVVPCHRVIGADGRLTGYGGGLDRKRWLLDHEGAAYQEAA